MIKSDESHKQPHTIQQGIYEVAELLLNVSSNAELGEYVLKASEIVGHTVGVDRVTLCRNEMIDDEIHFVIDYIFANEITKQFDKQLVEGIAIPYSDLPAWENMFLHGGCIAGPISEMGIVEQEFFSDFGTKSLVTVPIFFHEHLWGFLSAATCVDERDYNENEIEFLRLVSLMMASAVARVTMADKIKEANYLSLVQMEAIIEERTSALERALSSSKKTQATLERREKMLSALNRMSVILLSNNDETFENTMNRGLKLITEAAGVDRIAVYKRLGKSMSRLGQIYLWHGGTKPIEESARELPENPPVLRWLGKLWKGEGINSDASALPKDEFDFLDFFGVKGIYFVPIFIKAAFWGVVTLEDHTRYRTFDEDCLDLLQSAAHLCASVIIRTEMESNAAESMETLEHRSELINIANKIAFALLAPDNEVTFKESLATSLDMLGHFTNADIVQIWRNEMVDGVLHFKLEHAWFSDSSDSKIEIGISFPYSKAWKEIFLRGDHVNGPISQMPEEEYELLNSLGLKSSLTIPLYKQNEFWGIACIDDCKNERVFPDDDVCIFISIGLMLVNAITRLEQSIQLQKTNEQLSDALSQTTVASKAKGDFLSNMSHEMRTPLNAIVGMTAIGKRAKNHENKDNAFNRISDASSHLLGVINSVLDMAKIEANKLSLSPIEYHFEKMIQNVLAIVNFRAEEKQLKLSVNVDTNIPRFIVGDDQRLAQVITNLLSNAIKFTSNNGTVHLGATLTNEKDGFCDICIDVSDSGIGISPEHQKRLFQAFEQAESGITREYGGTGLGLVISKHIIELMGGKISLVSESGKGSRFSFNFKAARSNRSSRSMLLPGVNWDTVRVMVVDDIADTRDQVQGILTQIGIMCDAAADGFEALRLTEDFGVYDIYFIDWYMPGMNGILLTRKIKALATNKNSIVVMITAMDWEQFREEALEAGVCKCLLKPLLSSTIIDCVNNCLGISEEVRDTNIREFSGKTLLLAEDIEINREILSALLEETGITIDCAANGEDALTLISENPNKYDIVFMDLQMPKMDGLEATRRIRALPARPRGRLPIVAMTANVFKSDIEKCIDAGMDDHLGKPLDIDKVLEKLRAYLV